VVATASAAWADPAEKLGQVSFANSCSEAVQPHLQRAVALLHSFWWSEGDKAFRDVLQRDPSCAIAGWGVAALAIGNPYASGATPDGAKKAQEAIDQARAIGAKSERERGYIEAVAAYYDKFAERPPPGCALRLPGRCVRGTGKTVSRRRDPDLLGNLPRFDPSRRPTRPWRGRCRAPRSSRSNSRSTRTIPGVAHYLIHAYDYPSVADKGLAAAMCLLRHRALGAARTAHALAHLHPRRAVAGIRQKPTAAPPPPPTGDAERSDRLHALDYLAYASLQLARDKDAAAALEEAKQVPGGRRDGAGERLFARGHPGALRDRARHVAGSGTARRSGQEQLPVHAGDALLRPRALGAARSGNPEAAEKDLVLLRELGDALKGREERLLGDRGRGAAPPRPRRGSLSPRVSGNRH